MHTGREPTASPFRRKSSRYKYRCSWHHINLAWFYAQYFEVSSGYISRILSRSMAEPASASAANAPSDPVPAECEAAPEPTADSIAASSSNDKVKAEGSGEKAGIFGIHQEVLRLQKEQTDLKMRRSALRRS